MRLILACLFLLSTQLLTAQQKPTDIDKSPMDMSYWPANYPISKMRGQVAEDPTARLIYSRPYKKGRNIFGSEVKYSEIWRFGANEASEVEFFKNVKVGGKKLAKGRYTIYCIPTENKWTVIFNKDLNTWGSFTYSSDKDVLRVDVPVQKNSEIVEALTMYFDTTGNATSLQIQWDDLKVSVPVSL